MATPTFGHLNSPRGAVQSQNWVWDSGMLDWVPATQAESSGGAATIADGADVTQGSISDLAVTSDTSGTISGKLRGLVKWAYERMPASLGQKAMTASFPVVIASDQSSIPVSMSGTLQVDVTDEPTRDLGKVDVASLDQYSPVSGRLPVDGSGVTQPVSAASLPLPTGAATSALQLPDGHNVTVDNAAGAAAVNIQDGGNAITVDATDLDVRNLVFATDKVDVSDSVVTANAGSITPVTASWTSATPLITTLDLTVSEKYGTGLIQFAVSGGSFSSGTVTFGGSIDGIEFISGMSATNLVSAFSVGSTTWGATSGNSSYFIDITGLTTLRVTLSGVLVGAATVDVRLSASTFPAGTSKTRGIDLRYVNGVSVNTGTGASLAGTLRVSEAIDDLTASSPTVVTVGIASALVVASNSSRKGLILRNLSTSGQRISLAFFVAAVLDSGITLYPQDTFNMNKYDFDLSSINAIASAAGASLAIQEFA